MLNNPFNLPESFEESYDPYHVPKQYKNWLVISDLHVPYHNISALTECLNYGIQKKIDAILINGDGMDFYMASKFEPDPRKRNMKEEFAAFGELLEILRKIAPVFYKLGNHEERLERFLIRNATIFLGMTEFEVPTILRCAERNIEVIQDQRIIYIGHLAVLHGHEVNINNTSVNPARTLFLRTKRSAICGHLHQSSAHNSPTLDNKLISTWSTGHLGDPHPRYKRNNDWNHGCARIEVDADGDYEVINLRLINNKLFRS